jgi:hypothetical protein
MDPFLKWIVLGLVALTVVATVLIAVLLLTDQGGFSGGEPEPAASRDQFGPFWPLTVEEGSVDCIDSTGNSRGLPVFSHGGVTYALDEAAEQAGYLSIAPITTDSRQAPGIKMSLKPLRDLALDKC